VGEIGINRDTALYALRLWEVRSIIEGYRRRSHTLWESTRWQTFLILSALGCGIKAPHDLIRFPWEIDNSDAPTRDEVEELRKKLQQMNKKQDNGSDH